MQYIVDILDKGVSYSYVAKVWSDRSGTDMAFSMNGIRQTPSEQVSMVALLVLTQLIVSSCRRLTQLAVRQCALPNLTSACIPRMCMEKSNHVENGRVDKPRNHRSRSCLLRLFRWIVYMTTSIANANVSCRQSAVGKYKCCTCSASRQTALDFNIGRGWECTFFFLAISRLGSGAHLENEMSCSDR